MGKLACTDVQTLDGQAGMSIKATVAARPGRYANVGGDCESAEREAIDFHLD